MDSLSDQFLEAMGRLRAHPTALQADIGFDHSDPDKITTDVFAFLYATDKELIELLEKVCERLDELADRLDA